MMVLPNCLDRVGTNAEMVGVLQAGSRGASQASLASLPLPLRRYRRIARGSCLNEEGRIVKREKEENGRIACCCHRPPSSSSSHILLVVAYRYTTPGSRDYSRFFLSFLPFFSSHYPP